MIWDWIKHTVFKNPVTFILIGIIILGFTYDYLPIPEGKMNHIKQPEKPHSYWWFGKFLTIYIIQLALAGMRLINKISSLDKEVLAVYILFDLLGMLSYLYQGWPEPKSIMIIGCCLGCFIVISLRIWRLLK